MRKSSFLTILSLIGAAATAVIAYIKADDIHAAIRMAEEEKCDELTPIETAKAIVKPVFPVALSFAATGASMIAANRIDGKTITTLALGATGLGTAYKRYAREAEKILGPEGKKKLKEKLIGDKKKPEPIKQPEVTNPDAVKNPYYLGYGFDDYLLLSNEDIYEGEKEINYRIRANGSCTITELLEFWDIPMTEAQSAATGFYGWGNRQLFDEVGMGVLTIDTEDLSENDNGETITIMTFAITPEEDYDAKTYDNKSDLPWEE